MIAAAFSGRPSESAMTTLTLQPRTPPAALRSSSAISMASRIASPPTTVPGAERGAIPPMAISHWAKAAALAPRLMAAAAAVSTLKTGFFIEISPGGRVNRVARAGIGPWRAAGGQRGERMLASRPSPGNPKPN